MPRSTPKPLRLTDEQIWFGLYLSSRTALLAAHDGKKLGHADQGVAQMAAEAADRSFASDVAELRKRFP